MEAEGKAWNLYWVALGDEHHDFGPVFDSLSEEDQKKVISLVNKTSKLRSHELRNKQKWNSEGAGIFGMKPTAQLRIGFFYRAGNELILTHAFIKKVDKWPAEQLERAKSRRETAKTLPICDDEEE